MRLGRHLYDYRKELIEQRDALVTPPSLAMRTLLTNTAAVAGYDRADRIAKENYQKRLQENPRARELDREINEISEDLENLQKSREIALPRIQGYKYELGDKNYIAREPLLLKESSLRKTLEESQAQSRKISKEKLEALKQQTKQEAPVEAKAEEWEEIK